MAFFTRHRENLRKQKNQEDIPDGHSCVCAHCGRLFPGENENGLSDTSLDTDNVESEDNS
jgi:hypothetical protein